MAADSEAATENVLAYGQLLSQTLLCRILLYMDLQAPQLPFE